MPDLSRCPQPHRTSGTRFLPWTWSATGLSLTDEQEAKLIPIFERRIAELQKVRDQFAEATTEQQKHTVLRNSKSGQDAFNSQVEAVLDASQKSEWRELRAETREKVKERYEQKQDSR